MMAVMSTPVTKANELLQATIEEVQARGDGGQGKAARLMVCGTGNEQTNFIEIIEESGANVVIDDLCFGSRP